MPSAAEVEVELKARVHNLFHHALPLHDETDVDDKKIAAALQVPGLHREDFVSHCLRLLKLVGEVHGAPRNLRKTLNLAHDLLAPIVFDLQPGLETEMCQLFLSKMRRLEEERKDRSIARRDAESLYNLRKHQVSTEWICLAHL